MRECHRPSPTDRIQSPRLGHRQRCHPSLLVQRNSNSQSSRSHHCLQCPLHGTRRMNLHRRLSAADPKGSTYWTNPTGCLLLMERTRKKMVRHLLQLLPGRYSPHEAATHRIDRLRRRQRCQCSRRQLLEEEPPRHRSRGRNGARLLSTTRRSLDWTALDAVEVPVSTESWLRIIRFSHSSA